MAFAPTRVNFPDSSRVFKKSPEERSYIENIVRVTRQELETRTRDDTARPSILLAATDDSVWAVSVDTEGVLTTTRVR